MDDPRQRSVEMYMPAKVHCPAPWLSGIMQHSRRSARWCLTRSHGAAGEAAQCAEAGGVLRVHGELHVALHALTHRFADCGPQDLCWAARSSAHAEGFHPVQVGHLVGEARSKATSIQQSVSKALTGKSEEGFTMGMRSPAPSYGPQPAWVQFLKSGESSIAPFPPDP